MPDEAFNRCRTGRQHWCRECFRAYFRARGSLHRRQARSATRARQRSLQRIVLEHLEAHPCTDCGEGDVRVLEFDHVVARDQYVARLVRRAVRPEVLRAEMARCEVVCANCHRRRTARRASWRRLDPDAGRLHRKAFVDENLRWLYGLLARASCADCGLRDALVLEHDHVGAKRGNVMTLAWDGYSRAVLEREIASCVVRCVNCHRRRTVEAGRWFRALGLPSEAPPP